MKEKLWSRNRGQNSVDKEFWEIVGNCEANGQCSEGDNCSLHHDVNKRAKTTQSNPSPSSSTRQTERNASRTRSPRGRMSQVEECFDDPARITSEELAPTRSVKSGTSRMLVLHDQEWLQIWRKVLVCTSSG